MAQAELEARLRVLMGGYAAERLVLGSISTGAENDLKEATRLASQMVAHYGMSERLGPVYYDHEAEHPFLGQRMAIDGGTSAATIAAIEEEARRILARALEEATDSADRTPARELDRLLGRCCSSASRWSARSSRPSSASALSPDGHDPEIPPGGIARRDAPPGP